MYFANEVDKEDNDSSLEVRYPGRSKEASKRDIWETIWETNDWPSDMFSDTSSIIGLYFSSWRSNSSSGEDVGIPLGEERRIGRRLSWGWGRGIRGK